MRRTVPVLAVALATATLAFALVAGGSAPAQAPPSAKPNVVVVMTDDQTVEQMRALERVRTRIGRAGTTFARNFSTYPLCCPSRSTYLTGQYAHNHGVRSNKPPEGGYAKLDSTNTLPVWLQAAGYATAHIGSTSTATEPPTCARCRPAGASGRARWTRRPTTSSSTA